MIRTVFVRVNPLYIPLLTAISTYVRRGPKCPDTLCYLCKEEIGKLLLTKINEEQPLHWAGLPKADSALSSE